MITSPLTWREAAGDAAALAELMHRVETSRAFQAELEGCSHERAWITDPKLELESWRALLAELEVATG